MSLIRKVKKVIWPPKAALSFAKSRTIRIIQYCFVPMERLKIQYRRKRISDRMALNKAFKILETTSGNEELALFILDRMKILYGPNDFAEQYQLLMPNSLKDYDAVKREHAKICFTLGNSDRYALSGYNTANITSANKAAKAAGGQATIIGEPEEITIQTPPVVTASALKSSGNVLTTFSNPFYYTELKNATIYAKSDIVITETGEAVHDIAAHPQYGHAVNYTYDSLVMARKGENLLLNTAPYTPVGTVEKGIFLCGLASQYYGHWVPEYLPRIRTYENHPEYNDYPFLVDEGMPESHYDILRLLSKNPVIKISAATCLQVQSLLIAPPPTFYPVDFLADHGLQQKDIGPLSPASLEFIRESILNKITGESKHGEKIYLSRKNMKWRHLLNDKQVSEWLAGQGFDIIDVETLTFEDQVRMFKNAKVVVAPNGSSLLNIIYSSYDLKVIALSQPDLHNWGGFYGPMQQLGFRNIVFATGTRGESSKHSDYEIPIESLKAALGI